jgi:hypothetical protein
MWNCERPAFIQIVVFRYTLPFTSSPILGSCAQPSPAMKNAIVASGREVLRFTCSRSIMFPCSTIASVLPLRAIALAILLGEDGQQTQLRGCGGTKIDT